jgi:hypothetical protein
MLLVGGTPVAADNGNQRQCRAAFSDDGRIWTRPQPILSPGDWLWRVTWRGSRAYGISYRVRSSRTWTIALYESFDGLEYHRVAALEVPGRPNEATLRFRPDGKAVALVRREGGDKAGWMGSSAPPYESWRWRSAGLRVGGPNFLWGPKGIWAAFRDYTLEGPVTVVALLQRGTLHPVVTLPSGGDCSYPGMAWLRGVLWVSYYSSHEGRASIYLARLAPAKEPARR